MNTSEVLYLCRKITGAMYPISCYALDDIFDMYRDKGIITADDVCALEDIGRDLEEVETWLNGIFGTEEGQAFDIWLDISNPDHVRILNESELKTILDDFNKF